MMIMMFIPPPAPHPALPCPSYLFVILSCFSKAVICLAPYEHRRPHMSIPVQYSTPGLLTAAHTLHVHPTHTETPAMKTCSQIRHHPTWSGTAHILHTGTPAMKSCSLRISAHCPSSKDTIFMIKDQIKILHPVTNFSFYTFLYGFKIKLAEFGLWSALLHHEKAFWRCQHLCAFKPAPYLRLEFHSQTSERQVYICKSAFSGSKVGMFRGGKAHIITT